MNEYQTLHAERIAREKRARSRKTVPIWKTKNPDKLFEYTARRRAKLAGGAIGDRKAVEAFGKWMREAPVVACYWCKRRVPKRSRHADHIVPLSKGGAHSSGNLCVSCALCNLSKGDKMPDVFAGQSELKFA